MAALSRDRAASEPSCGGAQRPRRPASCAAKVRILGLSAPLLELSAPLSDYPDAYRSIVMPLSDLSEPLLELSGPLSEYNDTLIDRNGLSAKPSAALVGSLYCPVRDYRAANAA
jgi:hypothetical protein